MWARPIPVFPAVPSTIVPPGRIRPGCVRGERVCREKRLGSMANWILLVVHITILFLHKTAHNNS